MIEQCGAIVELATKRCYTKARDSYFAMTVTDWFGGRGHDFDCLDERANAEGGMLVVATSIPDAREWAQWKGRTARQDRPGQYLVVLSAEDEPFASEPGLAEALSALPPDEIIAELLRRKDAGIAASLAGFEAEQARGAWLNEMCEAFYREHSRAGGVSTAWPSQQSRRADLKLRAMLEVPFSSGAKIREAAADRLGLSLEGPPAAWGWAAETPFGIEPRRPRMAVIFLIDRTFEGFLQKVVDAVLKLYDKYLEPDDLVGYYGLGDGWIFDVQPKGSSDDTAGAALRQQIVDSVEKRGEPEVYSSIETCVEHLAAHVDGAYSKWLVVLTDTVDFQCVNDKNQFDKESPARAEAAVARVIGQMNAMAGLNLVLLDASGIANFNAKHTLWPTWRRLSQRLTDEVGEHNPDPDPDH